MSSELPAPLRAGLERLTAGLPGSQVAAAARRLSDRYREDRPAPAPILADRVSVAGYLTTRMPATYAAVQFALAQTAAAVPDLAPAGLLDLGAGTGAATWAAADVFGSLTHAHLMDAAPAVLAAAEDLLSRSRLAVTTALGRAADPSGWPPADLAVAAYLLSELTEGDRRACVDGLAAAATTVVVVEPGTPAGYARMLAARQQLLAAGMTVAAPCPHDETCPMAGTSDWCHFGVRLARSAAHRRAKGGDLGFEDEKLSWVAGTRLPVPERPGRVVHRPRPASGHTKLVLCTPDGLVGRTYTKRDGVAYRQARDAVWGGPAPTG